MSMRSLAESTIDPPEPSFEIALEQIAARAGELDARPRFPSENFASLKAAGISQLAGARECCDLAREAKVIRALASADAATARILDGHFNGVERLALTAGETLRERELEQVRQGALLLGVWGADPAPGEGTPARIEEGSAGAPVLRGVKTFCSGAGGVQRALVIARGERDERRLAYVDVTSAVWIDRAWYRASGLRASESHRVEFRDAPVLAVLGGENEIMREPWFSRDAVRTAATWAGIADCILQATVNALAGSTPDEVRLHAVGRMRVARASIDRWLEHSVSRLQDAGVGAVAAETDGRGGGDASAHASSRALAAECRLALAEAARLIAAEAARVCGARALIDGGNLDRARRDLDIFLLQHRLDPKLVELGSATLEEGRR
jgi:alkylation response protein AidB-like acyl-CoA dehydrogenase